MSIGSSIKLILEKRRNYENNERTKQFNEFKINNHLSLLKLKEDILSYYTTASPGNVLNIKPYELYEFKNTELEEDSILLSNLQRYLADNDLVIIPIRRDNKFKGLRIIVLVED